MTSLAQTKMIHALRRKIPHYADADYRAYLMREFRVDSSRALTDMQARRVIDMLKTLAGANGATRRASETADGPYAAKLRALWISGYHLGVFRSRDDKALIAFVQRQAKVAHTRFLTEPREAAKAIEAMKAMLTREAGVEWPQRDSSRGAIDVKCAVAKAACAMMVKEGAFKLADGLTFAQAWPAYFVEWCYRRGHVGKNGAAHYTGEDFDAMTAAAGRWLRVNRAKAKRRAA